LACTLLAAASSSASVNPLPVLPKAAWVRPCGFFVVVCGWMALVKAHVAISVTLRAALNSRVNRYTLAIEFGEKTMSAVAENIETEMPEPINFTDSAAAKVADLIAEEGNPELKLRVFVQGGGCSGFQYGFTFDEVTNEDDTTMTKNGVSLLIDAMSYQYLLGAEIDYKEDLQGAQFVIKNPNATTTCGCGSSFSV
jgi:iron-sulfur cluster insertion protein